MEITPEYRPEPKDDRLERVLCFDIIAILVIYLIRVYNSAYRSYDPPLGRERYRLKPRHAGNEAIAVAPNPALIALTAFPILKRVRRFLTEDTHPNCDEKCKQCSFRIAAGEDLPLRQWNRDLGNLASVNRWLRAELWPSRLRTVVVESPDDVDKLQAAIPPVMRTAVRHISVGYLQQNWRSNVASRLTLSHGQSRQLRTFIADCRNLQTLHGICDTGAFDSDYLRTTWSVVTHVVLTSQSALLPSSLPRSFPNMKSLVWLETCSGFLSSDPRRARYDDWFGGTCHNLAKLDLYVDLATPLQYASPELQGCGGPRGLFEGGPLNLLVERCPSLTELNIRLGRTCLPNGGAYHLREWVNWIARLGAPLESLNFWIANLPERSMHQLAKMRGYNWTEALATGAVDPTPIGWTPIAEIIASKGLCEEMFEKLAEAVPTLRHIRLSHEITLEMCDPTIKGPYKLVDAELRRRPLKQGGKVVLSGVFAWRPAEHRELVLSRIDLWRRKSTALALRDMQT